jgi:hypothetical protein
VDGGAVGRQQPEDGQSQTTRGGRPGFEIIQPCICVISTLVIPFITYLFVLKDLLKNENTFFLRFFFSYRYFTTTILETATLNDEKI